jgi:ankyrin repeat protein
MSTTGIFKDIDSCITRSFSRVEIVPNKVQKVIKSINTNKYDLIKTYMGDTPLIYAIKKKIPQIALALIATGKLNLGEINNKGKTALIYACSEGLNDVALSLLATGQSRPEQVSNDGSTALMYACSEGLNDVALALLATGQSRPEQVSNDGLTALMYACSEGLNDVALALLATGQSRPEQVSNEGSTALIGACSQGLNDVALALLATGQSRPEQVSDIWQTTALLAAADNYNNRIPEVILALIETGNSRPDYISVINRGKTALIAMVDRFDKTRNVEKQLDAVKALLATGQSLPDHEDMRGMTALDYAISRNIPQLEQLLEQEDTTLTDQLPNTNVSNTPNDVTEIININANGFDQITQETHKISDFLTQSINNICIKSNNTYFLTTKDVIRQNLTSSVNIKYGCKQAGNGSRYILDSNIIRNTKYFSLNSIIGLQGVIDYNKIEEIISNQTSSQLFGIIPTDKKLPAIISEAFINGGSGVGADHCQTGKETTVYTITVAQPLCGETNELDTKKSKKRQRVEEDSDDEDNTNMDVDEDPNQIKIQYKGQIFSFPITETSNLEDVKRMLLEKLMADNLITSINSNVKFIYKGKIYKDNLNSVLLSSLENPPFGMTLQAMVNTITGGRKTRKTRKTIKKTYRRKTKKRFY